MVKPYKLSSSDSVLKAVGFVILKIYKLLFSGLDERAYQSNRRRFIEDLNDNFSELLSEHAGRIHPTEGQNLPRAFDYVAVTLEFPEIRLQLIKGRGELSVRVAPSREPEDWQELGSLYKRPSERHLESLDPGYLYQAARYIRNHWNEIVRLYVVDSPAVIGQKRTKLSSQLGQSET
jgi:hypothetical protein